MTAVEEMMALIQNYGVSEIRIGNDLECMVQIGGETDEFFTLGKGPTIEDAAAGAMESWRRKHISKRKQAAKRAD